MTFLCARCPYQAKDLKPFLEHVATHPEQPRYVATKDSRYYGIRWVRR